MKVTGRDKRREKMVGEIPLICYPDVFGTDIACYETDETCSTAQFKDGFGFEEGRTSLEEI